MKNIIYIFGIMFTMILSACEGNDMSNKVALNDVNNSVPNDQLEKVSNMKIYFGHQSVGSNIVDGVDDLLIDNSFEKLNIIKSRDPSNFNTPVFGHSGIGENEDPILKIKDFEKIIKEGLGSNVDVAFMKFCYIDINKTTDIDKMFHEYKNTMNDLKSNYPHVKFVHVTVPLTLSEFSIRSFIKQIIGRPDNNIMRKKFNTMLINEYSSIDPIFDLARVESTYPNGEQSIFTSNGEVYQSLAPEYAADNGHLNEIGRRVVAKELIKFLSEL